MLRTILKLASVITISISTNYSSHASVNVAAPVIPAIVSEASIETRNIEPLVIFTEEEEIVEEPTEEPVVSPLSQEDIDLLALVTMAEAEGEPDEGKRLVIDTILNRVDSEEFPNTVSGVIYQRHQFSSMWNGRVDRCYVKNDIRQLVIEESITRTNSDVIYFTAGKYGKYGTPMFRVSNHYFSSH